MQQRLADMGGWLRVNGEAIYGTRSWDKAPAVTADTKVYYTRKGNDLYVICTKFPEQSLTVKGVSKSAKVSLLGYSGKVGQAASGSDLKITPPSLNPATNPCQYAWVFKVSNAL